MKACDVELLSEICKNIGYDDLILSAGLSSAIGEFTYADSSIAFPIGRPFICLTALMDRLEIPYETVDVKTMMNLKSFDDVIILLPKEILNLDDKRSLMMIKNIFITYSAYMIDRVDINKQLIFLKLAGNQKNFKNQLSFEDLLLIEKTVSLPLGSTILLLRILNTEYVLKTDTVVDMMLNHGISNLNNRVTLKEGCTWIEGVQFYSLFEEKIVDILNSNLKDLSSKQRVTSHIFFSCMRSGTVDFFRRGFAEALKKSDYFTSDTVDYVYNLLRKVSRLYTNILILDKREGKDHTNDSVETVRVLVKEIANVECMLAEKMLQCN